MTVDLPATLPPGEYKVIAGLYNWQSGERLPVRGKAARADGAVQLGTIQIIK